MDETNSEETRWRLSRYAPPKPAPELRTLDEHYAKMYGNKPASGEWTAEMFDAKLPLDLVTKICQTHNAALAAEREQGVKALAERSFELHECQQQLTAALAKLRDK